MGTLAEEQPLRRYVCLYGGHEFDDPVWAIQYDPDEEKPSCPICGSFDILEQ